MFQTKLTYGMICYDTSSDGLVNNTEFQTKLTYGMICYSNNQGGMDIEVIMFQTKLTYGMICYSIPGKLDHRY